MHTLRAVPCVLMRVPSPADQLGVTVNDDGLELWPQAGASFNIGIMMFRPASMLFVGETLQDALMQDALMPKKLQIFMNLV